MGCLSLAQYWIQPSKAQLALVHARPENLELRLSQMELHSMPCATRLEMNQTEQNCRSPHKVANFQLRRGSHA